MTLYLRTGMRISGIVIHTLVVSEMRQVKLKQMLDGNNRDPLTRHCLRGRCTLAVVVFSDGVSNKDRFSESPASYPLLSNGTRE